MSSDPLLDVSWLVTCRCRTERLQPAAEFAQDIELRLVMRFGGG